MWSIAYSSLVIVSIFTLIALCVIACARGASTRKKYSSTPVLPITYPDPNQRIITSNTGTYVIPRNVLEQYRVPQGSVPGSDDRIIVAKSGTFIIPGTVMNQHRQPDPMPVPSTDFSMEAIRMTGGAYLNSGSSPCQQSLPQHVASGCPTLPSVTHHDVATISHNDTTSHDHSSPPSDSVQSPQADSSTTTTD
ncbi:hypothetical protein B0O80DRAFT_445829 [Mortierella sp. GBAus27b]|nr:hypothetical protein B0O80DRAFT_445829 [Mortierella sp. GBAus27b]